MEWETFGGVAAVVAVLIGILTPVIKLNSSVTKLNTLLEQVSKELRELKEANSATHKSLWDRLNQQEKELSSHETRLRLLEKG